MLTRDQTRVLSILASFEATAEDLQASMITLRSLEDRRCIEKDGEYWLITKRGRKIYNDTPRR